jgi:hypothetical protein
MNTSLDNFRTHCLEATLDLLWRQWCSLGVSGHSAPASRKHLIDPEALILATTSVGRQEPRMFDEALDWLGRYGSLINLQRLKNLQKSTGLGDDLVLASVADYLAERTAQPRWKSLVRLGPPSGAVEPLFLGLKVPTPAEPDPAFLRHGLRREFYQPRGLSRPPNPTLPPNLVLALRALIGVSARVEVILCLAGGSAAHASELARLTGYAPRTLQTLLQEMTLSGHLLTQEPATASPALVRRGANRRYHLPAQDWAFLTPATPLPQWVPWASLFGLARQVIEAIPAPGEKSRHAAVVSSKVRDSLVQHGQALAAAGLLPALDLRPTAPGEELLKDLAKSLPSTLAAL